QYQPCTLAQFEKVCKENFIINKTLAETLNINPGTITQKSKNVDGLYNISFAQAFLLYANIHLNEADFLELIDIMRDDGFKVDYE
ncbi:MAG: hypothetical protein ACSHWU_13175, partial [Marinicella sp.]